MGILMGASAVTETEADSVTLPGSQRGEILIADADAESRRVLEGQLREQGFHPCLSEAGDEAVALAVKHHPLVVILDTRLPGMDGYETCRQLKARAATRDIPVILVGNSDEEDLAFSAGGDDFVTRPIQMRRLVRRIDAVLLLYDLMVQQEATDRLFTKYATRLSVASEVGRQITSILSQAELTKAVVDLLQARFDYSFVSLWQWNDRQDLLVLRASAGQDGKRPPAENYALPKDLDNCLITAVAQQRQILLAPDGHTEAGGWCPPELARPQSELAIPLQIGTRMVGVLDLQSDQPAAFDNEDSLIFQALADQVTVAVRNAELYDLQKQRRAQAELLEQTGRVLSGTLDIGEVQSRILTELKGVLPYQDGFVFRQEADQLLLLARHTGGGAVDSGETVAIPLCSGGPLSQLVVSARPVAVDDLRTAPGWTEMRKLTACCSWLGMPLVSHDKVIGILALTRAEPCAFGPSEVIFLSTFAAQAAVALENAALYAEVHRLNAHLEELVSERTAQLEAAYKALKKMDQAKADFIDIAAHELRTPLTVMKGYLTMMRLEPTVAANPMLTASVNGVLVGADRLHGIVNSMLDVAKINNQTLTLACSWLDLRATLAAVKAEFSADLAERHQGLELSDMAALPKIYADRNLLHKVFGNLVVNAIKYTPDGGTLKITAAPQVAAETPAIEVRVSDTGIGIDAEQQALIFDQFYQVDAVDLHSSGRSKFKGSGPGLGLAIARGIVQAHKGRIWVESAGQDEQACPGSCFHVLLPLAGPDATGTL